MSLQSSFDREMEIYDEQLADGSIDSEEYGDLVAELESDMREYHRE